ncbi:MAG: hypothetical protein AAGJ38_10430 [Planctomycetota bacterium]
MKSNVTGIAIAEPAPKASAVVATPKTELRIIEKPPLKNEPKTAALAAAKDRTQGNTAKKPSRSGK